MNGDAKCKWKLTRGLKNEGIWLIFTWRVMQSLKKNWFLVSKIAFNASIGNSENLHFDVLLLSIAYKFSGKKEQKSYLLWHTVTQNWYFVWKMTWEIWCILTWAVKNLKICTLKGYFCQKYEMFELK